MSQDPMEHPLTLTLTPLEHGVLMALVGLGMSMMVQDAANARAYVGMLSNPGVEPVSWALIERLTALDRPPFMEAQHG
jgi:hypothetical protein